MSGRDANVVLAAMSGNIADVQNAIQQGGSVNSSDEDGYTPLIVACDKGHLELAKWLLDNGADPNAYVDDTRMTPLHFARGNKELCSALLKHGADPDAKNIGGRPALTPEQVQQLEGFDDPEI